LGRKWFKPKVKGMLRLKAWICGRREAPVEAERSAVAERRGEARRPVFQEAQLTLDDYYKIRAVITELSANGARVRFASRVDLPFRIRVSAPVAKINCWARVAWQDDGAAGLEFQDSV
jgi:hypothetical protein